MENIDNIINAIDEGFDKELEARVLADLAKVDDLHEYLRMLQARDMRIHFTCPKEQQDLVRGAFYRMEYLSKNISKASK